MDLLARLQHEAEQKKRQKAEIQRQKEAEAKRQALEFWSTSNRWRINFRERTGETAPREFEVRDLNTIQFSIDGIRFQVRHNKPLIYVNVKLKGGTWAMISNRSTLVFFAERNQLWGE